MCCKMLEINFYIYYHFEKEKDINYYLKLTVIERDIVINTGITCPCDKAI